MRTYRSMAVLFGVLLAWPSVAGARPAHCTTSDDGDYACDFKSTDKDGSFQLSAPGKPLYILNMDGPGTASGFVNLGPRNISMAGRYIRSKADPACWVNDTTSDRICAR